MPVGLIDSTNVRAIVSAEQPTDDDSSGENDPTGPAALSQHSRRTCRLLGHSRFAWELLVSGVILILLPIYTESRSISEYVRAHEVETDYVQFGMLLVGSVFSISVIRNPSRSRASRLAAATVLLVTPLVWAALVTKFIRL